MDNNDFKWIAKDIYDSLIINLFYKKNNQYILYGNYEASIVLDVVGGNIDVKFANIDDITNLITMGMVRFVNIKNESDVIDIPIRKLAVLFNNAVNIKNISDKSNLIELNKLDAFAVIGGIHIKDGYFVKTIKINDPNDSLIKLLDKAYEYGNMGMQEKFDTLSDVNMANYRRINDNDDKL